MTKVNSFAITDRLPSTQIRDTINPAQFTTQSITGDRWERDSSFFRFEAKLDEIDRRLYNEEVRYARFMASRP